MNLHLRIVFFAIVVASSTGTSFAAEPAEKVTGKTVRLMTIGNSFSQNATTYLDDLAASDGNTLVLKTANVGGSSMQLHWEKAQLHEKDPQSKSGLYSSGRGLKEILADGPHDFVTIQMASIKSHDLANYRPYAAQLQQYVKQHAPEAELIVHETWAYRVDDPRFGPFDPKKGEPKQGEPKTEREMYEMLAQAYRTIAAELKVRLIPVGDAFIVADEDEKWGYRVDKKFDRSRNQPPKVPDQTHSLHVGFRWKPSVKGGYYLSMDGHHANTSGCYLAACVWYEILFDTTCVGNEFVASGIDSEYARFLQETAHAAVVKERARK
jgi:hypothetical protein